MEREKRETDMIISESGKRVRRKNLSKWKRHEEKEWQKEASIAWMQQILATHQEYN